MRARLVHDVLRVVFPRVGLRRRVCEQGRKPETKEGLPLFRLAVEARA